MNRKLTLLIILLLTLMVVMGGKLTGGFDEEQAVVPQYEVVDKKIPIEHLKAFENFIKTIDSMPCDSLFVLRNKLLTKQHNVDNEKISNLYSVLLNIVIDKAREEECIVEEQVEEK